MATLAVAFQARRFHDTFRIGAATAATECWDPTPGRPRLLPFHRGAVGRGAAVTLQNDDGVPLAAALDQFATPAERAAVAAWHGKTEATKRYFIAWRNNHEDRTPATCATPRPYEPPELGGGLCGYASDVKPIYLAAFAAAEACASRLTDALRSGAWVLRYQSRIAGAGFQAAEIAPWADMRIRIDPASLAAKPVMTPPPPPGRRPLSPPGWLLPTGHREPLLFKPAAVAESAPQVAVGERPASGNDMLAGRLADAVWNWTYSSVNEAASVPNHWQAWRARTTNEESKVRALREAITERLKGAGRWPLEKRSPKISK